MACYKPIKAYASGHGGVVFYEAQRHGDTQTIWLACGQCIGCKIERSRQWAVRIMHETQLHDENSFITLTYNDEHIPADQSLNYSHYQKFMRSLRKKTKKKLRFYMCGEYGEEKGRPHYHAVIFGHAFREDRYYWKKTNGGHVLYRSKTLEQLWKYGDSNIGDVTFESAQYVAGYVTKKLNGDGENKYYKIFDVETGEIIPQFKEFSRMSLKPGIGRPWLQLYWDEVKEGKVIVNGKEATAPKYYRKYFKQTNYYQDINEALQEAIKPEDQTYERLADREQVTMARHSTKKREIK